MKNTKKAPNPHAKHRQRMRQRFLKCGLDAMADHEVLELLLFYAIPRRDTNKIAHRIAEEFKNLHNLFDANAVDVARRCGLTENTAILIAMIAPLARRYNLSKWNGRMSFENGKALAEYAKSLFIGETSECFYIICLDNDFKLISAEFLERGTDDRIELYPKEILRRVIQQRASYVVLTHNHPSGSMEISAPDVAATSQLRTLLSGVEVEILDHIVVCGQNYVSFAEKKILGLAGIDDV